MGGNILSSNGSDWRRHRKVTSPAFDNRVCVVQPLRSFTKLTRCVIAIKTCGG